MLKGTITFRDKVLGSVQYSVYGQDSFDALKLYIMNENPADYTNWVNAMKVYDQVVQLLPDPNNSTTPTGEPNLIEQVTYGYQDVNPPRERRLDIKKTNKYKTNITNHDFASKVAALVRYIQITGKRNYNQGLMEAQNPEQYFDPQRLVNLGDLGYIKFEMGLIIECNIKAPYVDIQLFTIDTPNFDIGIFKELKEKDNYGNILTTTPISNVGFGLNEETLGFHYEPPVAKEPANMMGMYPTIQDVIEANPDKNTAWILKRKYVIVDDNNLEEVMDYFYSLKTPIAFDTETTGLKINFKSRSGEADELVGVVLSGKTGEGYYFPLQHKLFKNLCNGDHHYFMEKYMKELLETRDIICHNIKFDWKVAYIYDIVVNCVYDTMLAFGVTKRYEDSSFQLSLKDLTRNIFGIDSFELSDFVTGSFGESEITFADLPFELVRQYAPADTDWTYALYDYINQHRILEKYDAQQVFEIEITFAMCVAYSEFFGYHVNTNNIPQMREEIISGMEKHKQEMFRLAGREFNPNSSQQLMKIMYDEMGVEVIGNKKTTNKEALKTLAGKENPDGSPKYPFVYELSQYRKFEGIYKNFLKKLHEFSTEDGYIFPEVLQIGTNTGRVSVKNPNYQSYNDPVKKNIVPRNGYIHFDSDFSQIEYRVLCSMAQQENLMAEFDDPDLDYHTYQASRMFSIPYSLVSKTLRSQSKGINFGLPYGMGDSSLGARIFGARTDENTRKAAILRKKFFEGQEKIEQFFEVTRANGVANNFTSTYWGRRRYYDRAKFSVKEIRRQAGNHVIQGTAADIYKISVNRLFKRCIAEGWLGKVLFNVFVHDEVLVEVHQSINMYYFFKAWREEFQLKIDGFCKLYAGAGVGLSWYEAKKQDLPPQYINELIDQYHPDMDWHENIYKFIQDSKVGYEDYKIRRIKEYCTDLNNDNEVVKPVIYALLVEMVDKVIDELHSKEDSYLVIKEYNEFLGEELIYQEPQGKKQHGIKRLKHYLGVFQKYYNMEGKFVNLLSADEVDTSQVKDQKQEEEQVKVDFQDYEYTAEDMIRMKGYYLDEENNILYFEDKTFNYEGVPVTMSNYLLSRKLLFAEGRYQLALYNSQTRQTMLYQAFTSEAGYQEIITINNQLNFMQLNTQRVVF